MRNNKILALIVGFAAFGSLNAFADANCFCKYSYGSTETGTFVSHADSNTGAVSVGSSFGDSYFDFYYSNHRNTVDATCLARCNVNAANWANQNSIFCKTPTGYKNPVTSIRGNYEQIDVWERTGPDHSGNYEDWKPYGHPLNSSGLIVLDSTSSLSVGTGSSNNYASHGCATPPYPCSLSTTPPAHCTLAATNSYGSQWVAPPLPYAPVCAATTPEQCSNVFYCTDQTGTTDSCQKRILSSTGSSDVAAGPVSCATGSTLKVIAGRDVCLPPATAPVPVTDPATGVTQTSATLHGHFPIVPNMFPVNNGVAGFSITTADYYTTHGNIYPTGAGSGADGLSSPPVSTLPAVINLTDIGTATSTFTVNNLASCTQYYFQYHTITRDSTPGMQWAAQNLTFQTTCTVAQELAKSQSANATIAPSGTKIKGH